MKPINLLARPNVRRWIEETISDFEPILGCLISREVVTILSSQYNLIVDAPADQKVHNIIEVSYTLSLN